MTRIGARAHRPRNAAISLALAGAVVVSLLTSLVAPLSAVGAASPAPADPSAAGALFGFADLHTHQFANLGFGGLMIWGKPFSPDDSMANALPYSDFLPAGVGQVVGVGGVPVPPGPLPAYRPGCPAGTGTVTAPCPVVPVHGPGGTLDVLNAALGGAYPHPVGGYPQFDGWPAWNVYTTQQMYYEWLQRAWQGGERVMTMLAVNNESLCGAVFRLAAYGCDDTSAIARQVQAAKDFEAFIDAKSGGPGRGWYRIAYSGAQARQIVQDGKLAVVLGTEVPSLFGCKVHSPCTDESVKAGVQSLYDMGIRQVFPVHNADNGFGGSALYNQIFDLNNKIINGDWFSVGSCPQNADGDTTNDLRFHLTLRDQINDAAGDMAKLAGSLGPFDAALASAALAGAPLPPRPPVGANCNQRQLQALGQTLVSELMTHHMLIDVDHMSTGTQAQALDMAAAAKYPGIVMSHTGLADLGVDDGQYTADTNRHEGNKDAAQLARINELGGLTGVILHQGGRNAIQEYHRADGTVPVPFTCGESSQAWAQAYLSAVDRMGGGAVALGSDFNGLAGMPAPRSGPSKCHGDVPAGYDPGPLVQYPFQAYGQPGVAMPKMTAGTRTFDYNVDGLSNAGMLPDFIEDLRKVGMSDQDLAPLFRSADAYVRMWEKAEDTAPPIISCASPDAAWHAADVSLSCTASDAVAGLDGASPASFSLRTSVPAGTQTDNATTDSRVLCDRRGNCATAGPFTGIKVDEKGPVVTITSPAPGSVLDGSTLLNLHFAATDGPGSGVASVSARLDGTEVTDGQVVDPLMLAPGPHALVVDAADAVRNVATANNSFSVAATSAGLANALDRAFGNGLITDVAVYHGLQDKLAAAEDAHERGQHPTEWKNLAAFINQVTAQRAKGIDSATADRLIAYANDVVQRKG